MVRFDEKLNLMIAVVLIIAFVGVRQLNNAPATTSDPWFEQAVLESSQPVVVKFGAEWCGPCRQMDAALANIKHRYPAVRFVRIDIDQKPDLFNEFRSGSSIPQMAIFEQGRIVSRQRGFAGEEALAKWLARYL